MEDGLPDRPRLTRSDAPLPRTGIVHLGLGAFFRAHGALYIAEAMEAAGGDWGILGVSLKRPDQRDKLEPQGCAYTAVELGPEGETPQVVEVVQDVLVAPEGRGAVLAAMADPGVRIVTLTVTEKGYVHSPSTGRLNREDPDVRHDLGEAETPRTAPGFLVRALELRRRAGLRPFTVLTCDNLPENGPMVRGVVLEMASLIDAELSDWIANECRFPATMVDRIVPATTDADVERVAELTGRHDASPVLHEPFRQWVIEDAFVDGARPAFEKTGVQLVSDVTPFELMKLRCLNGTHSSLAYLGYLAGHETIAETVADRPYADFARYLWREEIVPTLAPPEGEDLGAYTGSLLERYRNPGIRHRTWQIAMDGSQKLPQRILGTISDNLEAGRPISGLSLAVAAWMRYVGGVDEDGSLIEVKDPLADRLKGLSDGADTPEAKVAALLSVEEVFPATLASTENFRQALTEAYAGLVAHGARSMVERAVP